MRDTERILIPSKELPGVSISKYDSLQIIKDEEGDNKELLWWHTAFNPRKILDPGDPCFATLSKHCFFDDCSQIHLLDLEEKDLYTIEVQPSIVCCMCARHIWIHMYQVSQINPSLKDGQVRLEPPNKVKSTPN